MSRNDDARGLGSMCNGRTIARLALACLLTVAAAACAGGGDSSDGNEPDLQSTAAVSVTEEASSSTATTLADEATGDDVVVFEEEFDAGLDNEWRWVAEDPGNWSLTETPGALRIIATASPEEPLENLLIRPVPEGDFEVTTILRFQPSSNFQFAGLVVYESPSEFLQLGRAFCDAPINCVGDGIYFDSVEAGQPVGDNHGFTMRTTAETYLRIRSDGDTYTGSYSADGETWITIGSHNRRLTERSVGLVAHQATVEIAADFDYFSLSHSGDGDEDREETALERSEPANLIRIWANPEPGGEPIRLEVITGEFRLVSGTTAVAGSSFAVYEEWMELQPGLGIEIGEGGVELGGTFYEEGTLLIVDSSGHPVVSSR